MSYRILWTGFLLLSGMLLYLPQGYADCSAKSASASFGSLSSFTVAGTVQTVQSGTGFTCTGSLLSLASTNTVNGTIAASANASGTTSRLYNAATGSYLPYSLCKDSACGSTYNIGNTINWSSTTLVGLLGLFNSSDGSLPVWLRTTSGSSLPAGTYTDTITINWNYRICFIGILGICSYTTGSATSTINISLVVVNDCYIDSAPSVNFGTAALPGGFAAINSALSVRCTSRAAYTINLTGSNAEVADWRQMSAIVNGTAWFLQYKIVRPDGSLWSSSNNFSGTGTGTSQNIGYTATVNSGQAPVPSGSYSDTITVTLSY